MKKRFALLLVLALVISMMPTTIFANEEVPTPPVEAVQEQVSEPVQTQTDVQTDAPASEQQDAAADLPDAEPATEQTDDTMTAAAEEPLMELAGHPQHDVCGRMTCADPTHTHEAVTPEWLEIKNANISTLAAAFSDNTAHYFFLGEDVTVAKNIMIGSKTAKGFVHLCLNGHTLTVTDSRLFSMYNGTASICDCMGTGRIESKSANACNGAIGFWQQPTKGEPGATIDIYGGTLTYAADTANLATHGFFYVTNDGILNLYGGTIDGQNKGTTATSNGGGAITVHGSAGAQVNIHGGKIENCKVSASGTKGGIGGAVFMNVGTFTMDGGAIENNTAAISAGGVYINTGAAAAVISGSARIQNNKLASEQASNLHLVSGKKIDVGALSDEAKIGITMAVPGVFSDTTLQSEDLAYFTSDQAGYTVKLSKEGKPALSAPQHEHTCYCGGSCTDASHVHVTQEHDWIEIKKANVADLAKTFADGQEHYLYLGEDVTVSQNIKIGTQQTPSTLHLCLNGHKLTVTASRLFSMYNGLVTVCDCVGTGRIEAKSADACNGAIGFWQQPNKGTPGATLEIYGGTMTYAEDVTNLPTHGLFYLANSGVLSLYSGTIDGLNKGTTATNGGGGGVTVSAIGTNQFNMYGGMIENCKASAKGTTGGQGGGILVWGGSFTMTGGVIRNCSAAIAGGGVYVNTAAADAQISGSAKIQGNTLFSSAADNLFLASGRKLVLGTLAADASIGITMAAPGVFSETVLAEEDLAYFTSDNANYQVKRNQEGKPRISAPQHEHTCYCGGTCTEPSHTHVTQEHDWIEIKKANVADLAKTFADDQEHYLYLGEDVTVSQNIIIGTQQTPSTLHLCLNGHKITVTASRLFNMYNGTATVCDCVGTGRIEAKPAGASNGAIGFWQQPNKGTPGATLEIYGGTMTYAENITNLPTHGLFYLANSAVLSLYSGTIDGLNKGTTATSGGGGGVTVSSIGANQFNMYGGVIENCKVDQTTAGKAGLGGGVFVQGGTFTMTGGVIRNCSAAIAGGGVYVSENAENPYISGSAVIQNNTAGGETSNLYLGAKRKISFGTLGENAAIGITMQSGGLLSEDTLTEAELSRLSSDKTGTSFALNAQNQPILRLGQHSHDCYCGGTCTDPSHTHVTAEYGWTEIRGSNISELCTGFTDGEDHYFYLGENVTVTKNIIIGNKTAGSGRVHLCLNGYTITVTAPRLFDIRDGIATVCDCKGTGRIAAGQTETVSAAAIVFWQQPTLSNPGAAFEAFDTTFTYTSPKPLIPTHGLMYAANEGTISLYNCTFDGRKFGTTTNTGGGGAITLQQNSVLNTYGGTFKNLRALYGGALYISAGCTANLKNTLFEGNKAGIDGEKQGRGGAIYNSGNLTLLEDNVFRSNNAYGHGGAIFSTSSLLITNGHFENNRAAYCGGALYLNNLAKTLTISGGVFTANRATNTYTGKTDGGAGGAIFSSATVYLLDGIIDGNYAYGTGGGGLLLNQADFVMSGGKISNNYYMKNSGSGGAGVYSWGGKTGGAYHEARLIGGTIEGNFSYYNGGGFLATHLKVTIDGTTFSNNYAKWNGAGYIAGGGSYTVVKHSEFIGNECEKMGAGMLIQSGSFLNMENAEFNGNHSVGSGSALCIYNVEGAVVKNCSFIGNTTGASGAAIYCRSRYKEATFDNLEVAYNYAKVNGGAFYFLNDMTVKNCKIHHNAAKRIGGVMYASTYCAVNYDNCHIYDNKCGLDGGALWTYGYTELNGSLLENNTAGRDGGAIFNKVAFNFDSYVKLNEGTVLRGNKAARNGGAVATIGAPTLTELNGAEIYKNRAGANGGGLFNGEETKLTITAGAIHDNTCSGNGGGLYGQGNVKLLGGSITNNTCGGIGGGAYLSNELSDSGSLQHNNFTFGPIVISANHANTADSVYMTKTAAGMVDGGVLQEGADFTIQLETNRTLTQLLQGAFDYQKVGENTYHITAASNALRPTEIDANGVRHFIGEVVDPKDMQSDYDSTGKNAFTVIEQEPDEDEQEQTQLELQDKDDESTQEQSYANVLGAEALGISALAAAMLLNKHWFTK